MVSPLPLTAVFYHHLLRPTHWSIFQSDIFVLWEQGLKYPRELWSFWLLCSKNALNCSSFCLHLPRARITGATIAGSRLTLQWLPSMAGHVLRSTCSRSDCLFTLVLTTSLTEIQISDTREMASSIKLLVHEEEDLSSDPWHTHLVSVGSFWDRISLNSSG